MTPAALTSRRGSRLVVLAATSLVAACAPAPPPDVGQIPHDVYLVTSTRYYALSAGEIEQLRAGARTVGPFAEARRWAGATQSRMRWSFSHLRRGMVCMLHDVRVFVTTEIRLPRWEPETPPDSATAEWWKDFSARMFEHERGHVRIAVDGAREIAETLRPLEGSVSCETLTMRANGAAQLVVRQSAERHAEYDRLSGHGAVQAADSVSRVP
jgi:predicted secreted Zn-dependent protease